MNARVQLSVPIALLIVVLATVGSYCRVIGFDFTSWDDYETVARNPKLAWPMDRALREFWTRPQMDLYVPATYTLWRMTAVVAGRAPAAGVRASSARHVLNPHWFHALNLLLHAVAACVVLLLLRQIVPDTFAAMAGALLFALHPLQVETVGWVSGTKDLLCALLSLVALWQYVRFARLSATSKALREAVLPARRWGVLSVGAAALVLAMLSKPTAVMTPFIAIVIDCLIIRRPPRDVLRTVWPWLVLIAPCLIWTRLAQPATHAVMTAPAFYERPMIALDALAFYLWKFFLPVGLTFDYGRLPSVVIQKGWIWWTWTIPAACAVLMARGKSRGVWAGALIAAIALLPVLGLVPFDFQSYSTVADHYVYLPMLGAALASAWLVARRPGRGVSLTVMVVLFALGLRSWQQTTQWRDSQALFTRALTVNRDSFAAYNHLAAAAVEAGHTDQGIDLSRRAIAINPRFGAAHEVLGDALRIKGQEDAALAEYSEAVAYLPDLVPLLTNLAALLAQRGRLGEALPIALHAAALEPDSAIAHLNLGRMYLQIEQPENARRELRRVLTIDPTNTAAVALLAELNGHSAP